MKKVLCLIFAAMLLLSGCTAPQTPTDSASPVATPTAEPGEPFDLTGEFVIVKSFQATKAESDFAAALQAAIKEATGLQLAIRTDVSVEKEKELVVGAAIRGGADEKCAGLEINDWILQYADGKILLLSGGENGYNAMLGFFKDNFIKGNKITLSTGLNKISVAPPEIIRVSPENNASLAADTTPALMAYFISGAGIDTARSFLKIDGVTLNSLVWEENNVTGIAPKLATGEHTLELSLTDNGGQTSVSSTKFVIKPLSDFKFYRGEVHSHTAESDGEGTLDEAYTYARDEAKLDFFAVTDHSQYFDWDYYSKNMIPLQEKYTVDGKYVALYGFEVTWGHLHQGHANVLMPSHMYSVASNITLQEYYEQLSADPTGIGQFNHPDVMFGKFEDFGHRNNVNDEVMALYEFGGNEGFDYYGDYFYQSLALGWHLSPVYNEDNHHKIWGDTSPWHTVIMADELTLKGVTEAIHQGRTYITNDNTLEVTYTVNGTTLGGTVVAGKSVKVRVELKTEAKNGLGKVELLGANGATVATYDPKKAKTAVWEIEVPADSDYFLIRIDNNRMSLLTAPIYIEREELITVENSVAALDTNGKHALKIDFSLSEPLTDVKVEYWLGKRADTDLADEPDDVITLGNVADKATATGQAEFTRAAKTLITARISGKNASGATVQHIVSEFMSPVYITEVVPLTATAKGTPNATAYIEIYNNTDEPLELHKYKIALFAGKLVNLSQATADGYHFTKGMVVEPRSTAVIWICPNDSLTASDFNAQYGTDLVEGKNLFKLTDATALPSSTSHRTHLVLVDGTHEITRVSYNYMAELMGKEYKMNTAMEFTYHTRASKDQTRLATKATPTPGKISDGQIPVLE